MNKNSQKQIEVYADWVGLPQSTLIGVLYANPSRGKEIFSFEYSPQWLANSHAQSIDPALPLFNGKQYPHQGHENFGAFLDSSPDRWGRLLMDRREAQLARKEGRKEEKLLS